MQENKQSSRGLVAIIVILIVLLLGAVVYICYDKGVFDNLLGKEKPIVKETKQEEKLSEEEIDALRSNSVLLNSHGETAALLYFDHNVSLDSMSDELVNYMIKKYGDANQISTKVDVWMNEHENDIGDGTEVITSFAKSEVDSMLKTVFATDKALSPKESTDYIYMYDGSLIKYNAAKDNFDVVSGVTVDEFGVSKAKMVKHEQKGDSIYVYEKVVNCRLGQTVSSSRCYTPSNISKLDNPFAMVKDDSKIVVSTNGNRSFDFDYIFEKYTDKIDIYKTTFKKASDGKYYWYSSEIVNE